MQVSLRSVLSSVEGLVKEVAANYVADAIVRSPFILGSLDMCGNPTSMFNGMARGLQAWHDLMIHPALTSIMLGFGPFARRSCCTVDWSPRSSFRCWPWGVVIVSAHSRGHTDLTVRIHCERFSECGASVTRGSLHTSATGLWCGLEGAAVSFCFAGCAHTACQLSVWWFDDWLHLLGPESGRSPDGLGARSRQRSQSPRSSRFRYRRWKWFGWCFHQADYRSAGLGGPHLHWSGQLGRSRNICCPALVHNSPDRYVLASSVAVLNVRITVEKRWPSVVKLRVLVAAMGEALLSYSCLFSQLKFQTVRDRWAEGQPSFHSWAATSGSGWI